MITFSLLPVSRNRVSGLFSRVCSSRRTSSLVCAASFSSTSGADPLDKYYNNERYKDISELIQFQKLLSQLDTKTCLQPANSSTPSASSADTTLTAAGLSAREYLLLFDSALITHCLHIWSRIAAFEGQGFYTIGPCGEECVAPAGLLLLGTDSMALHYRHLSAAVARQLKREQSQSSQNWESERLDESSLRRVVLDRARGYVVSKLDPVGGGSHCLLGSADFAHDYIITSTLASQLPPALGRAVGASLCQKLGLNESTFGTAKGTNGFVSFVSVGDGSVNNAHFLSAVNNAAWAAHNGTECPLLIGISNNKLAISLKDESGWLDAFLNKYKCFETFRCDGTNMLNVAKEFGKALQIVRDTRKPAIIVFDDLPRQFGHAASDRQNAYLTQDQIKAAADRSVLSMLCSQCEGLGLMSFEEIKGRLLQISSIVQECFESAKKEPKLVNTPENRRELRSRNSQPLAPYLVPNDALASKFSEKIDIFGRRKNLMRKLMNAALEESLIMYENCVYIGEDVRHGGYYLVTEGLADKYNDRVTDYPPDETTIMGLGMGFAQAGLVPIVEIPYAKYLDCGADMFFEAVVMNWLSNGKQPNGMLIRLQGFANGLFGGNFHTHNSLYLPPGLDVVCYSNGGDYARGMRYNMAQARSGRVVMSVDCTALLNSRHVYTDLKESSLMLPMPAANEYITFDDCIVYPPAVFSDDSTRLQSFQKIICTQASENIDMKSAEPNVSYINGKDFELGLNQSGRGSSDIVVILAYGLGVNIAREAQKELQLEHNFANVIVVDTPYLPDVPQQLYDVLERLLQVQGIDRKFIVFADICKEGQNPYSGYVTKLQNAGLLGRFDNWRAAGAVFSYNPLGQDLSFLNKQDVVEAVSQMK